MIFAKGLIANVKDTDDDILAVYVGTKSNIYYNYPQDSADNNFKSRDWYVQAMANPGQIIITNPYISKVLGKNVVSIARTIENNTSVIGVVSVEIDLAMFSNSLSEVKVGNNGYIFVADNEGNIISHPQQTLIAINAAKDLSFWAEATSNHE
jgi:methyl-accepting chemotaxis protein